MGQSESVIGIDFSGSKEAGEQIWVAEGTVDGETLSVENCWSAWEEAGTKGRREVYDHLIDHITDHEEVTVGIDFPFGLPSWAMDEDDWETRTKRFTDVFSSPSEMRAECEEEAENQERQRRRTEGGDVDGIAGYGWMLKTLTYYGISEFLADMIDRRDVSVTPMQEANEITLIETYPGATLGRLELNRTGYKSEKPKCYDAREENIDGLAEHDVDIKDDLKQYAICNDDAHDAVIATKATSDAISSDFEFEEENYDEQEGYIYV